MYIRNSIKTMNIANKSERELLYKRKIAGDGEQSAKKPR